MTSENLPTIVGVGFVLTLLSLTLNVYAISRTNLTDYAAASSGGQNATTLLDLVASANDRVTALDARIAAMEATAAAPAPAPAPVEVAAHK